MSQKPCEPCDQILTYLINHHVEQGYAPSYRQIGKHMSMTSTSSIHHHMKHLEAAGLVKLTWSRGAIPTSKED